MTLEEIKDKVRKLLRLARSKGATEAEATLAASKAQALLEEHKLAEAELGDAAEQRESTVHEKQKMGVRIPAWRLVLRHAVAETTSCFDVKGWDGTYHIFGKPSDIAIATELYEFLAEQIERLGREASRGQEQPRTFGNAFRLGCSHRVAQRLREAFRERQAAMQATHGERALVVVDDYKAAKALSTTVFPKLRATRKAKFQDATAYLAGKRAGDTVRLTLERKVTHQATALLG